MSTPAFPAGRYGRRRGPARQARWLIPVLVVAVVALTTVLAVVAYHRQTSEVQASVRNYAVSDSGVSVTFEVSKPADRAASCDLRARDTRGAVVGHVRVPLEAKPRTLVITRTVPTHARAVSGEVVGCRLDAG
ncbi:MAG: DUF4307 domain-containing protein [Mycobacteriales bacterium]